MCVFYLFLGYVHRNCTEEGWSEPYPAYGEACEFAESEVEEPQVKVLAPRFGAVFTFRRETEKNVVLEHLEKKPQHQKVTSSYDCSGSPEPGRNRKNNILGIVSKVECVCQSLEKEECFKGFACSFPSIHPFTPLIRGLAPKAAGPEGKPDRSFPSDSLSFLLVELKMFAGQRGYIIFPLP